MNYEFFSRPNKMVYLIGMRALLRKWLRGIGPAARAASLRPYQTVRRLISATRQRAGTALTIVVSVLALMSQITVPVKTLWVSVKAAPAAAADFLTSRPVEIAHALVFVIGSVTTGYEVAKDGATKVAEYLGSGKGNGATTSANAKLDPASQPLEKAAVPDSEANVAAVDGTTAKSEPPNPNHEKPSDSKEGANRTKTVTEEKTAAAENDVLTAPNSPHARVRARSQYSSTDKPHLNRKAQLPKTRYNEVSRSRNGNSHKQLIAKGSSHRGCLYFNGRGDTGGPSCQVAWAQ